MPVLINSPLPPSIEAFLAERSRTGADRFDEIWEGVLHVPPAPTGAHGKLLQQVSEQLGPVARAAGLFPTVGGFNLGAAGDYRVPDGGILRDDSEATHFQSAALVVEIVSPDDETYAKLSFYAEHRVDEVLILEPTARLVRWLGLVGSEYHDINVSGLIPLGVESLVQAIVWPQVD